MAKSVRLTFEAIGTQWRIDVFPPSPESAAAGLRADILERIEAFDKNYSRFREDSLVTLMSQEAGTYTLPEDAKPLMDLYHKLYKISGGTVTPLIGQTLVEAGYDADYSLKPGELHPLRQWEDVMEYRHPRLIMKQPALLDFGAAGKGYLVDIIGELLDRHAIHDYVIDAGGDILHKTRSSKAVTVGLEHPEDPSMAIGAAHIRNQSLCGSAGNRRAWGGFHHIIDPRTLASPRHIAAAWVTADSALLADGLATAVYFVSPKELQRHFSFEYALVDADYSLTRSDGFPADFFVGATNEKIG